MCVPSVGEGSGCHGAGCHGIRVPQWRLILTLRVGPSPGASWEL